MIIPPSGWDTGRRRGFANSNPEDCPSEQKLFYVKTEAEANRQV